MFSFCYILTQRIIILRLHHKLHHLHITTISDDDDDDDDADNRCHGNHEYKPPHDAIMNIHQATGRKWTVRMRLAGSICITKTAVRCRLLAL